MLKCFRHFNKVLILTYLLSKKVRHKVLRNTSLMATFILMIKESLGEKLLDANSAKSKVNLNFSDWTCVLQNL